MMRRAVTRVVLAVVTVLLASVVLAQPAAADICKDAPAPVAPKSGLPGMLTTVPTDVPDSAADPFADKTVPIGDVYGYNWGWANYDLGCGSDFLRDPVAVTNTKSANVVMSMLGGLLAALASLEAMAKSSSLAWLTTVVTGVADKLRGPLLAVWLPLALLGVGALVGFRAKRASYADTLRTLLVVVGVIGMATFALVYPAKASTTVDHAVVGLADAAGKQFSASASDAVVRESAYRTWLTGNFGDADSAQARELGPRLLSATRYTWSDMKRMQADPAAKKQIDAAKATEFKQVAAQLKDKDPAGYETFTGRGERTAPALLGVVVVLAMSLFIALAMLVVLVSRVMMQGLALGAPLAALLGVLPTHRSVLARLWDLFTASVVAVAKFVVAGGVMALVLGAIQANEALGAGAKLFWVIVATVVAIALTKPIRSFKSVVPGLDPNHSYLRSAMSGVATYVGARFGAEDGISVVRQPPGTSSGDTGSPAPATTASADTRESLEPLERPAWSRGPAEADPVWTQAVPGWATSSGATSSRATSRTDASASEQGWDRGQVWPGVVAAAPLRPQLPAAPLRLETSSAGQRAGEEPRPLALVVSPAGTGDVVVDAPVVGSDPRPSPTGAAGAGEDVFRRPRATNPVQSGSEVVYATGVIVAAEEQPLYSRATTTGPSEVYVALPEPEIAADGTEHELVTYRSPVGASRA